MADYFRKRKRIILKKITITTKEKEAVLFFAPIA